MKFLKYLTISTIILILRVAYSDGSLSRFRRQTNTNECQLPNVEVCAFISCTNGRCVKDLTNVDCYKCICEPGYTGQICDTPITTPNSCNPGCENGGQCQETAPNTFVCVCPSNFTGSRCESSVTSLHPCVTSSGSLCRNGGTCTINGADYLCNCAAEWTGKNCETQSTPNSCNSNPCGTHGTCFEVSSSTQPIIVCNCESGWTGKYCDVNQSTSCVSGYCQSGGTCQMNGGVPFCICPPTHTGAKCETLLGSSTSTSTTSTTTSSIISTNCVSRPCQNGGTCFNTGNTFVCLCKTGWSGQTCNIASSTPATTSTVPSNANACSPNPCKNGGRCFRHGNDFVCVCTQQYTGLTCDAPKFTTTTIPGSTRTCADQPCQNGGFCYNTGNSYFCYCGQSGLYTGKNCETANLPSTNNCPLNCGSGYCVNASSNPVQFACMCNGVLSPTTCST